MDDSPTSGMQRPPGSIPGRNVVLVMFGFGCLATTTLWIYWSLHMMPFMPLQEALVSEFGKDCAPRVEGGQRKIHKNSTRMLRVILKVSFNPESADSQTHELVEQHLVKVRDIAGQHVDLSEYDTLELHLFQDVQESRFPQLTLRRNLESWEEVNEDGTPRETDESDSNV